MEGLVPAHKRLNYIYNSGKLESQSLLCGNIMNKASFVTPKFFGKEYQNVWQ
jgi:hypothetical protein